MNVLSFITKVQKWHWRSEGIRLTIVLQISHNVKEIQECSLNVFETCVIGYILCLTVDSLLNTFSLN